MRTIDDLGISKTPWSVNDHVSVCDRDAGIISGQYVPYNWANARLIAAAPDCYDALQRIVNATEGSVVDFPKWQKDLQNALDDARKALDKASGEEAK